MENNTRRIDNSVKRSFWRFFRSLIFSPPTKLRRLRVRKSSEITFGPRNKRIVVRDMFETDKTHTQNNVYGRVWFHLNFFAWYDITVRKNNKKGFYILLLHEFSRVWHFNGLFEEKRMTYSVTVKGRLVVRTKIIYYSDIIATHDFHTDF